MTRYLLDTNVIIKVVEPEQSASLPNWPIEQRDDALFIASLTIGPQTLFAGRILPFDDKAGLILARLMAAERSPAARAAALT